MFLLLLHYISFIFLHHDLDAAFTHEAGTCTDGIPALHNAVLNICVVADVYIVQNHGVLNHAVVADITLLENHRIFHHAVDNAAAGDQAVADIRARIIFCGRKSLPLSNVSVLQTRRVSCACAR